MRQKEEETSATMESVHDPFDYCTGNGQVKILNALLSLSLARSLAHCLSFVRFSRRALSCTPDLLN